MRPIFIIQIIALLIVSSFQSCQSEKFTEKGIPEVKTTGVTILEDGVTFYGEILSDGGKSIKEHGFTWIGNNNSLPEAAEYVLLGPANGETEFSVTVNSMIEKDVIYNMRAFIVTDEITSFGNKVTFAGKGSKPAELTSVTPGSGAVGDTVVIKGSYFSYNPTSCSVFFGLKEARVVSSTIDELRVIVPCSRDAIMNIRVVITGIASSNTLVFSLTEPLLLGFSPESGTFGDIIIVNGNNFSVDTSCFGVYFNDVKAKVTEVSRTSYKVRVPTGNNVSPATLSIRYYDDFSFTDRFNLEQAVIDDVSPTLIALWEPIVISGHNFNPDPQMNLVEVGGLKATVNSSTATEIHVTLPSGITNGIHQVTVTTIEGSPVVWDGSLEVAATWIKLADFPTNGRVAAAGFASGGKVYFGTGLQPYLESMRDFWEYDPATDQWTRKADYPLLVTYATGFSINGMGYFAMGKLDNNYYDYLIQYNPVSDSWLYLTPNPGPASSMDSPGFVINGKAYIPAAGEMHEYDPATQVWTIKSYPDALGYFGGGAAFSINGKGYLGVGWVHGQSANVSDFYEYDPITDIWTKKASFPGLVRGNPTSFALPNGKGYVGMGYSNSLSRYYNDMWEYDPALDTWTRIVDFPGSPRFGARAFVIGSEAYIVSGYGGIYEKDMWRFSPPH